MNIQDMIKTIEDKTQGRHKYELNTHNGSHSHYTLSVQYDTADPVIETDDITEIEEYLAECISLLGNLGQNTHLFNRNGR